MSSLKDISRICGVSITTVSKALRDYSDISRETKEKVRRVAEELEYAEFRKRTMEEDRIRKSLTYNVGLIIGKLNDDFWLRHRIVEEIELFRRIMGRRGFDITIINNLLSLEKRASVRAEAVHRQVDGVACFGIADPLHEEVRQLAHSGLPAVSIGTFIEGMQSIGFNYRGGIRKLLINAAGVGCHNILYIRRTHADRTHIYSAGVADEMKIFSGTLMEKDLGEMLPECTNLWTQTISEEGSDMQIHVGNVRAESPQEMMFSVYSLKKKYHPDGVLLSDMEMYEACYEALEGRKEAPTLHHIPHSAVSENCALPVFLTAFHRFPNQRVPEIQRPGGNIRAAILFDEEALIEEAVKNLIGQILSPYWEIEGKRLDGRIISDIGRGVAL